MKPGLAAILLVVPAAALAQTQTQTQTQVDSERDRDTGAANQAAHPAEKKPGKEALQPPPSPVRVDSDAVKLPDRQFELPKHEDTAPPVDGPQPDEPPPDEPPPPDSPKQAGKPKKKH